MLKTLAAVFLVMLPAASALAGRNRAVQPLPETLYFGVVTDASTHKPVAGADVTSGIRTVKTDVRGAFDILIPAGRDIMLMIRRSGYDDLTVVVNAQPPSVVVSPAIPAPAGQIQLRPRPPVTVKMASGETILLDEETVQFAYVLPFSSPAMSETANFCRPDGTPFNPGREEFLRILGPAVATTNVPCCKMGPLLGVTAELKNGEKSALFFSDSCFGYDVNLVGRERESAGFVYLKFTQIAEVVFP
jgi:hypothetical protein